MESEINFKVKKALNNKHMVYAPLGVALNVSQPHLSMMLNGQRTISVGQMLIMMEYLDMTWDEINDIELD